MQLRRRAAEALAIALVVVAYVFFATTGTMRFTAAPAEPRGWDNPGAGYYAQLAEGFLRGNTYLPVSPDPRLAQLPDPLDYGARDAMRIGYLWDASYYRGRYYLYFTPLPVVVFYVPYRWVFGHHAHDAAAAVFFSVWTLIAVVLFVRRVVQRPVWRILWIVFAGLANLLPFALSNVRVYEVAILAAMAFSASWAAALVRFDETKHPARVLWLSLWLCLAIAARPNLVVLVIPTVALLFRRDRRMLLAAVLPALLTAGAYLGYNFARFGNALETGITYQLNFVSMRGQSRCGIANARQLIRCANNALQYTFTPPRLIAAFPHADAATAHVDRRESWPGDPEEIVGMVPLVPLTAAGAAFGILLSVSGRRRDWPARVGLGVLGGSWLVLLALSTCWWIVSRYAFDFQILMLLGTIASVEGGLALLEEWSLAVSRLRAGVVGLAVYSLLLAILLGFEGRGGAFRGNNPELIRAAGKLLHVHVRQ